MICSKCLKPIEECKKADEQLIAPYDPRNNIPIPNPQSRFITVLIYQSGAYNAETNTFYYILNKRQREINDLILLQPSCIFQNEINQPYFVRESVIYANLEKLPLPEKYITLFRETDVYDYKNY